MSKEINEYEDKKNLMYSQGLIDYLLRTWATNIYIWTAVILYLVKSEVKFNNQVCLLLNFKKLKGK